MRHSLIICCLVILIQGCATLAPYPKSSLTGEDAMCLRWLEKVEDTFEEHTLNDPGTVRLKDFPQLRVNRFLASMRDRVTSQNALAEWLEHMRQLDAAAKKLEFANLPATTRQRLVITRPAGDSFEHAAETCGRRLNNIILKTPEHKAKLLEQAQVPDAYQSWKRIMGAYMLTRYAAAIGLERLQQELGASFKVPLEKLPRQGELIRYSPPPGDPLSPEGIAAMFKPAYNNPLAIPSLTSLQLQRLAGQFAPVWEIDTRNDTDKIGTVKLADAEQPQIDIRQPAVYVTHGYARWHGQVLLQLVYQTWLPAREKTGWLDLYGGPLDSVIWRVTLSPEGVPIAFDSIHGCGCYYVLFPGQGYQAIPPKDGAESILSPKSIATIPRHNRLVLRLQSRTHYLQQISQVDDASSTATRVYKYLDSGQLRSLPIPNDNKNHSLFGTDGIVDASARAERFLLWPYGVDSPGAMRQWGTHAIAFVGRRHFDDPFLLEKLLDRQ